MDTNDFKWPKRSKMIRNSLKSWKAQARTYAKSVLTCSSKSSAGTVTSSLEPQSVRVSVEERSKVNLYNARYRRNLNVNLTSSIINGNSSKSTPTLTTLKNLQAIAPLLWIQVFDKDGHSNYALVDTGSAINFISQKAL